MKFILSFSLASMLFCNLVDAAPLTIVEEGESRATIIIAAETNAQQAAEGIQAYIKKMSGAILDIVHEGQEEAVPAAGVRIYVGHTVAATDHGITIPTGFDSSIHDDAFEEEGYILKTKGNDIFIGGNSDGPYRGTIYGAYAFLETLGCRWYFPGEWGEILPKRETVIVPDLDIESRPDFAVRHCGLNPGWIDTTLEEEKTHNAWTTKIGFDVNQRRLYPNVGDGMLAHLLLPEEYWEAHPEYFAMNKKGVREKPEWYFSAMLCLSNPDVFTEIVKNVHEAFAGTRKPAYFTQKGFGITPPDGSPYCYCAQCAKNSQNFAYPPYVYGPQMSEEFFNFVVKLASEFPDKWVATMAYSLREMPPQGVQLPPNMSVYYAPISNCALHNADESSCWRRQEFVKLLEQWRRQTPHIYLYEYNPNYLTGMFVPERGTANAAKNIPIYKQLDVKGISAEGRKVFMETWTSYYVTAKLLWDSTTDVDALKEEFYRLFFGPEAGPHVQAWWDACEEAQATATVHVHEDFLVNHVFNKEFTQRIHKHVEAALDSNLTEAQRERVEAFALIADHLEAYAEMEEADKELRYADAAAAAARMLDDEHKLHDIYSFFISPHVEPVGGFIFPIGRIQLYEKLADMTDGQNGTMVTPLPLDMRFARDEFNEGIIGEWYAPDFDDSDWGSKDTFYSWDAQDEPEDEQGHDYDGYGWYRGEIKVPKKFKNHPVHLYMGGVINEAWIWINGRYVWHSPHKVWWWHPHGYGRDEPIDVSEYLKPGKSNTIAIRLWNRAEVGGLIRRGFFWTPNG